jgi:hypothetical protein
VKQLAQPSYRETIDSQLAAGTTHQLFEYQAPDRIHSKVTTLDGKTLESIQVGGQAWNDVGHGWMPGIALDLKSVLGSAGALAADAPLSGVTAAGQETVDGQPATDYGFSSTLASNGTSMAISGTIAIRTSDCLPVKLIEQSTAAGAATSLTITIGDYGQVSIQPPA